MKAGAAANEEEEEEESELKLNIGVEELKPNENDVVDEAVEEAVGVDELPLDVVLVSVAAGAGAETGLGFAASQDAHLVVPGLLSR